MGPRMPKDSNPGHMNMITLEACPEHGASLEEGQGTRGVKPQLGYMISVFLVK